MKRVVVMIALAGCQGRSDAPAPGSNEPEVARSIDAAAAEIAVPIESDGGAAEEGSGSGGSAGEVPAEIANGGDSTDDAEQLAKSATSAWQAVVDRDRYLARRGDKGVVEGRVGGAVDVAPAPVAAVLDAGVPIDAAPAPGPVVTWLVDDTEADGCLAIHVAFPDSPPEPGARVAVTGAWALVDAHRWYWKAASVTALPAGPAIPADPAPPGHGIAAVRPPDDARAVLHVGEGNGTIVFQILAPPRQDGDGWTIADQLGDPPLARLLLPGERPSYGGHDLRQPDERWQLKRGVTYWVRIGKIRRPTARPGANPAELLPVLHALGAPRRVP